VLLTETSTARDFTVITISDFRDADDDDYISTTTEVIDDQETTTNILNDTTEEPSEHGK
jgi:hypothetical protein